MFKQMTVLFALALPLANATVLTPGSTVVPSSLSTTGLTAVSGLLTGNISPGTFSADYGTEVYADTNNIFCSGCLDFVYGVKNNGPGVVERVTMFNFNGFSTNVGYSSGSGTVNPVAADRTTNGNVIGFSFDTAGLASGQSSSALIIQTNAHYYTSGLFSIQDGSAGTGFAYQPSSVPEPASMLLMGSALVAVGFVRKRLS